MLKIRDEIDLKELEKFGFKKDEELSSDDIVYSVQTKYQKLCVDSDKIIFLHEAKFETNTMVLKCNALYDLIKANLVEKVGGEDE